MSILPAGERAIPAQLRARAPVWRRTTLSRERRPAKPEAGGRPCCSRLGSVVACHPPYLAESAPSSLEMFETSNIPRVRETPPHPAVKPRQTRRICASHLRKHADTHPGNEAQAIAQPSRHLHEGRVQVN